MARASCVPRELRRVGRADGGGDACGERVAVEVRADRVPAEEAPLQPVHLDLAYIACKVSVSDVLRVSALHVLRMVGIKNAATA
eukprot:626520-Rhodomonas_salina.1